MAQLVYDATNPDLEEPDWGMFITICDQVNQKDDEYRKEVINALDNRLQSKNSQTVVLALCLLDTMEKNCNGLFHKLVCQKDFLNNLFRIAIKEQSPENSEVAADLIQTLALSFASVGKEYRLFETLYHSLRNRGVEFKKEDEVDIFTPNLSEETVKPTQKGVHTLYSTPNAKLENDLHIVQQHMVKMQGIIVKRNRRNNIPDNKQRELDDEADFLSQCLIRLVDLRNHYDQLDIPSTTRDVCNLLKSSIITLLQAYKDPSIDAASIRIFPNSVVHEEESEDSEDSIFSCVCHNKQPVFINVHLELIHFRWYLIRR